MEALRSAAAAAAAAASESFSFGLAFSIFSSLTLSAWEALDMRSAPRRRREKVAPTPAAMIEEFVMGFYRVVVSQECGSE